MRVVFPQPASAATIVIGAPMFALSFAIRRGRSRSSETARGASSFVRRKKFFSCIASDRNGKGEAPLCHNAEFIGMGLDGSDGTDGTYGTYGTYGTNATYGTSGTMGLA